jgi:hypothetical protein
MPDFWKVILQSPVVAATIVGLFGIASIWVGLGRFRSERWWERKAAAYASVIEGLHAMYDSSKAYEAAANGGYELSDDFEASISEASLKGWAEVRKGASIGSFVMTKRAAYILSDLDQNLERQEQALPTSEFHQTRKEFISNAIIAIQIEAKKDLRT